MHCPSPDVLLLQCYEDYLNGDSLTLLEAELVPDEFDDPMHHQALSIHYFGHAYELYMSGEVDFAVPLQAVEDRYGWFVAPKNATAALTGYIQRSKTSGYNLSWTRNRKSWLAKMQNMNN